MLGEKCSPHKFINFIYYYVRTDSKSRKEKLIMIELHNLRAILPFESNLLNVEMEKK